MPARPYRPLCARLKFELPWLFAATLAEDRGVITQPAALPVASTPMATPVPLPTVTSLIPTSPPSPAPAAADLLRHDPPAPLGVAELRARITMLEQRRAAAQARGDTTNARTIGSALTKTRKRLRDIEGPAQEY